MFPFSRAVLAVGLIPLLAAGCAPREQPREIVNAPERLPAAPPVLPQPPPPMTRADLIAAVQAAASATATAAPYPKQASSMAGRSFRLQTPLGCSGLSNEGAIRYEFNDKRQTLKFIAEPQDLKELPWAASLVSDLGPIEAAEGFWLRRPWILDERCPVAAQPPTADASPETLALMQVFEKDSSRLVQRGGRPYETLVRAMSEPPAPGAYRFALEGRVADVDNPVRCRIDSAELRPTCLILVEFERVAFLKPDGAPVGEWTP